MPFWFAAKKANVYPLIIYMHEVRSCMKNFFFTQNIRIWHKRSALIEMPKASTIKLGIPSLFFIIEFFVIEVLKVDIACKIDFCVKITTS